ncbi:MAG: DUF1284 domain-containing protein [Eubacteriales bacterium]|nr:DUF1284 domain-containing protein [Eubacteriales bacterium]
MLTSNQKPVQLRPHHGMCLAFFEGKGYSSDFTVNMGNMLDALLKNPKVQLTVQTDVICKACPNRVGKDCEAGEKVERYDRKVLEFLDLPEHAKLTFREFTKLVEEHIIQKKLRESICGDCQWNYICSEKVSRWAE